MIKPRCCNQESKWVEYAKDKGYWFCEKCRNEVADVSTLMTDEALQSVDDPLWNGFVDYLNKKSDTLVYVYSFLYVDPVSGIGCYETLHKPTGKRERIYFSKAYILDWPTISTWDPVIWKRS